MYVGFDVEARLSEFESGGDIAAIAADIFSDFQNSNPTERIKAAARELAALSPDFIGLQEVTLFIAAPLFSFDYLSLLIEEIRKAGGPDYEYLVIENMALDESVSTGLGFPIAVYFSDSEALLYKKDFSVKEEYLSKRLGTYREPVSYDDEEIVFYRSLLGSRFFYGGRNIASVFTTHLDQDYLGTVQPSQMSEILDLLSEYEGDDNLILMGDFNSEEGDQTYEFAPAEGFIDTYRSVSEDEGLTCCNLSDLSNKEAMPYQKIDLIFNKSSKWRAVKSEIILNTREPIWPSDHFGVLTTFQKVPGSF